ncbi:MAG: CPBP family intramembrane metalloprotease [Acidobacteria bacterium]|nr:CPBP family intramembrane metalloprotease [Acidobacteriota bacterium]
MKRFQGYLLTLGIGWILLAAAGLYYARLKGVPAPFVAPLLAAFLVEYAFYLLPGFERLRRELRERLPILWFCGLLALSALAPYLIYSLGAGQFYIDRFGRLAILVGALSFWYVFRRPTKTADLAVLALVAAALLTRLFARIYVSPVPGVRIDVLGQLMLIRLTAMVMLEVREVGGVGFGFLPSARDWKVGLRYFAYFAPVGLPAGMLLGVLHFTPEWKEVPFAPLVFLGALWVVALSEELFFRGLLQQWLQDWTGRPALALALASVVSGACHLGFRGFPNWRFALVAAIAHGFYGRAYQAGGGIRAAMVAHALTVTLWRTLF